MDKVSWADFEKLQICVGTILKVENNEGARKASYRLWVDFGSHGVKQSSAQITVLYNVEELVGRQVVGVLNFEPKRIAGFLSECLITGFANNAGAVVLCCPEREVPNGTKLF